MACADLSEAQGRRAWPLALASNRRSGVAKTPGLFCGGASSWTWRSRARNGLEETETSSQKSQAQPQSSIASVIGNLGRAGPRDRSVDDGSIKTGRKQSRGETDTRDLWFALELPASRNFCYCGPQTTWCVP